MEWLRLLLTSTYSLTIPHKYCSAAMLLDARWAIRASGLVQQPALLKDARGIVRRLEMTAIIGNAG